MHNIMNNSNLQSDEDETRRETHWQDGCCRRHKRKQWGKRSAVKHQVVIHSNNWASLFFKQWLLNKLYTLHKSCSLALKFVLSSCERKNNFYFKVIIMLKQVSYKPVCLSQDCSLVTFCLWFFNSGNVEQFLSIHTHIVFLPLDFSTKLNFSSFWFAGRLIVSNLRLIWHSLGMPRVNLCKYYWLLLPVF